MTQPNNSISFNVTDNVGTLLISNPDKFNALNQKGWETIPAAIDQLITDGARVIVVSGDGDNFCAGADISEFDVVRKNEETAKIYEKANADAFAAIAGSSVPTIASISGYCLGGGFGIAAACDLRFASDDAVFAIPAAKLGLAYPVAAMRDIVAAIGEQTTKQMLFTAARFDAARMSELGFLSKREDDRTLGHVVAKTAVQIAKLAPLTHRATKAAIESIATGDTHRAEAIGNATFSSKDYSEGRQAFREKRRAIFTGE